MGTETRVWRNNSNGKLYHDDCFLEGEPRTGYSPMGLDQLEDDDECESCTGVFLSGLTPQEKDEDDEEEAD